MSTGALVHPGEAPTLAVVIVAYETPELLRACLRSLATESVLGKHPVIVVDNSASDDCARVSERTPGVTLIKNPRNLGYARAVNQGIAASSTDYVLVLNPDIELLPGAVNRLVMAMEENPEAGLAGAKLLNPDGTLQHSCRRFYTPAAMVLRRTFLGRLFPEHQALRQHLMLDWDHATERDVDWLLGACLLVRRRAVEDVGPMDERFFLYFEDVDWCARMHNRGWKVLYVPDAVMVHHHRRESARGGLLHPSRRIHLTSVLRFYEKWSLLLYLIKRNRDRLRGAVLMASDVLALNGAFLIAFGVRKLLAGYFAKPLFAVADYWQFLLVFNLAAILALRRMGFYRRERPTEPVELGLRVATAVLLGALAVLVSSFLLYIRAYSRFVILLTVPLAVAAIVGARMGLDRLGARLAAVGFAARRVLLVGDPKLGAWMAKHLATIERPRFEVVGPLDEASLSVIAPDAHETVERLRALCRVERVQEVMVADADGRYAPLARSLAPLVGDAVKVRLLGPWATALTAGATLEEVAGVALIVPAGGQRPQASVGKRTIDLAVAFLGLLVLGPVALAVRLHARSAGEGIEDRSHRGSTVSGEPAPIPDLVVRGEAAGFSPVLNWVSDLGQVLGGRLSLVGIHRLSAPPRSAAVDCRGTRPGLIVPPVGGTPSEEKVAQADVAYVLGWSFARDVRLVLDRVVDRLRR